MRLTTPRFATRSLAATALCALLPLTQSCHPGAATTVQQNPSTLFITTLEEHADRLDTPPKQAHAINTNQETNIPFGWPSDLPPPTVQPLISNSAIVIKTEDESLTIIKSPWHSPTRKYVSTAYVLLFDFLYHRDSMFQDVEDLIGGFEYETDREAAERSWTLTALGPFKQTFLDANKLLRYRRDRPNASVTPESAAILHIATRAVMDDLPDTLRFLERLSWSWAQLDDDNILLLGPYLPRDKHDINTTSPNYFLLNAVVFSPEGLPLYDVRVEIRGPYKPNLETHFKQILISTSTGARPHG